ncbi:MAG: class I SAM-dependent methyltransferase [Candidatus Margulisbacteria bacterium]|nr:class I SAM-dependent methyltransferase [Candidatus Margulisiibacteriota bacterium]
MKNTIINLFRLSSTKDISNLDDPATTIKRVKIIQQKPFLKRIYIDFYKQFKRALPSLINSEVLVELGSGAGFIKEIIPNVITSDIIPLPNVDKQFSATNMPFDDNSIDAFFMIDVLHHINDVKSFFKEAQRCLKDTGKIVMIEPANTLWGKYIYQNFHHESFDTSAGWDLEKGGPLTSANGAIPWIIFYRDKKLFEKLFPNLKITRLKYHTPFSYLISGGFSFRQLLPSFSYNLINMIEHILIPFNKYIGMFQTIELTKISSLNDLKNNK